MEILLNYVLSLRTVPVCAEKWKSHLDGHYVASDDERRPLPSSPVVFQFIGGSHTLELPYEDRLRKLRPIPSRRGLLAPVELAVSTEDAATLARGPLAVVT